MLPYLDSHLWKFNLRKSVLLSYKLSSHPMSPPNVWNFLNKLTSILKSFFYSNFPSKRLSPFFLWATLFFWAELCDSTSSDPLDIANECCGCEFCLNKLAKKQTKLNLQKSKVDPPSLPRGCANTWRKSGAAMVCTAKRPQPGWLSLLQIANVKKFGVVAVNTKCRSFISLYSVMLYRGI